MLLGDVYKKIISRLKLSSHQLAQLEQKLQPTFTSRRPFVHGQRFCPISQALSVKVSRSFNEKEEPLLHKLIDHYGISKLRMIQFYCLYTPLSSFFSSYYELALRELRAEIQNLRQKDPSLTYYK